MAEAKWKLVVDQQGVTISNDRFSLTTAETQTIDPEAASIDDVVFGVDGSGQMEAIISELEAMTKRTYGQFCGLSRALEVVGERWALFIVRDLLVGPKSFSELRHGLPRISTDVLSTRLREMEHAGVVRRVMPDQPEGAVRYTLTEYGAELDGITLKLGLWGARLLGTPRPDEIVTTSSLIIAMRATFQSKVAADFRGSFEIRIGEIVFHLKVADGKLDARPGPLATADLRIEPGTAMRGLLAGEITPDNAASHGIVYTGDPALLARFTEIFRIVPPAD